MIDDGRLHADERALTLLLIRHARGTDRCDEELMRSCYHPDAIDDHGDFKGLGHEFAAIVAKRRGTPLGQHALSNMIFDIRGDVAFGETLVTFHGTKPSGQLISGFGRYIDRFERRDGEWKIAYRRTTLEGSSDADFDFSNFVKGSQDRSDPSYDR